MANSPKRKTDDDASDNTSKRARLTDSDHSDSQAEEIPLPIPSTTAPDSHIDHDAAIAYWSSTEPTVAGVLGGYPQVSRVDLQGSSNFLAKLRRQSKHHSPGTKLRRVADCGAGIGRVTAGFLSKVAESVDIIEPVRSFTDQIAGKEGVGKVYNVGLEAWTPEGEYEVIWNQWCLGQLTDAQVVEYLRRLPGALREGGWVVVKENLSNHHAGVDVFDETDSSVTRTDAKFRALFEEAGYRVVSTELQKGMPQGLYAVRSYALQPRSSASKTGNGA